MSYTLDETGNVTWVEDGPATNPTDSGGVNPADYVTPGTPAPQAFDTSSYEAFLNSLGGGIAGVGNQLAQSIDSFATPTQPTSTSQKTATSGSVGQSFSGLNPDAFPVIEGNDKKKGGFASQVQDARDRANAFAQQAAAQTDVIAQQKSAGEKGVLNAEILKQDEDAKLQTELATMQRDMALQNKADYDAIGVKTQKYMADYQNAVAELANSTMNPGRALQKLSNSERVGTMITAFVTDFLGAAGVKTNGMNYIQQGIDRDIQAQRDGFEQKRQIAADKFNVYKMFREQGDSDYLAAEKTRGVLFAAAGNAIKAKLAGFDSNISRAKLPLVDAMIGEWQLKNYTDIHKAANDQFMNEHNTLTTQRGQTLQAAAASAANKLGWAELKDRKDARAATQAGPLIPDDWIEAKDANGKVFGIVPKTEHANVQDRIRGFEQFTRKLGEYQALARELGSEYKGLGSQAFTTKLKERSHALLKDLAFSYALANNGTRPSDADLKLAVEQFATAGWMTGIFSPEDASDAILAKLGELGYGNVSDYEDFIKMNVRRVPQNVADALSTPELAPGTMERAQDLKTAFNDNRLQRQVTSTEVDKLVGDINSGDGKEHTKIDKLVDVPKKWRDDLNTLGIGTGRTTTGVSNGRLVTSGTDVNAPLWFNKLEEIADKARYSANNDDRQAAVNALYNFAQGESNYPGLAPNKTTKDQAMVAYYLLNQLQDTPAAQDLVYPKFDNEVEDAILKYRSFPPEIRD